MTALLMAYALVVGVTLGAAGVMLERVAGARRWPRRWMWAGVLTASLLLGLGLPWVKPASADLNAGSVAVRLVHVVTASAGIAELAPATWWRRVLRLDSDAIDLNGLARLDSGLAAAWALGSLAVVLLFFAGRLALRRRRAEWRDAEVRDVRVWVASDDGPAVVGLWRPRILLPEWALAFESRELELMLAHEREHLCARDPLLMHLAGLAVVVMPWNPAVWWMLSRLKLALELDCDARVLGLSADESTARRDRAAYGELLLTVASHHRPPRHVFIAPAMLERSSSLTRRIAAIYPAQLKFARLRAAAASAAACAFLAAALLVPTPNLRAQESAPAPAPTATPMRAAAPEATPVPAPDPQARGQNEPAREQIPQPGSGMTWPTIKKQVDPEYTAKAKEAKIEGAVWLEAIVEPDGRITAIRVTKSLDKIHGLDQAAIDAVSQWEFNPATRDRTPVAVRIEMELEFRLSRARVVGLPAAQSDDQFVKGAYVPGDGVTSPRAKGQASPGYTPGTMREKIQGIVIIEAVIGQDGTVHEFRPH